MCEKNISYFSKTKIRCRCYECWYKKKKSKENLNFSASDEQTTASTQIATNKDPSAGFPTQEESGNQCSA